MLLTIKVWVPLGPLQMNPHQLPGTAAPAFAPMHLSLGDRKRWKVKILAQTPANLCGLSQAPSFPQASIFLSVKWLCWSCGDCEDWAGSQWDTPLPEGVRCWGVVQRPPVVSGERTFLHYPRDFSGPTTSRRVSISPANVQNPPHCLLPWGPWDAKWGGRTFLWPLRCPLPSPRRWAQGQRPFTSLDGESSSTETLNVQVLSRVTFLPPPPTPDGWCIQVLQCPTVSLLRPAVSLPRQAWRSPLTPQGESTTRMGTSGPGGRTRPWRHSSSRPSAWWSSTATIVWTGSRWTAGTPLAKTSPTTGASRRPIG